jgi:excisionase family DNA binding protein
MAVQAGSATAWRLAEESVFPGESELIREQRDLTVEGQAFRIEFRLQQGILGLNCDHDRTMVALRVIPSGQATPECPWTLHVRGDWPERMDRLPRHGPLSAKRLRKAVAPKRRREADPYRNTFMSEDVYIMPRTPPDDLSAQLVLFVLQSGLSDDPGLFQWLQQYVERTFRIRARDRGDVARDVVLLLIRNKWWAEDAKAWRKYVALIRDRCERDYRSPGRIPIEALQHQSSRYRALPPANKSAYDPSGNVLTVEEASRQLGVSRSTLYSLIDHRLVAVENAAGRMLIARAELERVGSRTRLKTVIDSMVAARGCGRVAARKYVSRLRAQGHSLNEIARTFAVSKPEPRLR